MNSDAWISDDGKWLKVTIRPSHPADKVALKLCQYKTPMLDYAKDEPECLELSVELRPADD